MIARLFRALLLIAVFWTAGPAARTAQAADAIEVESARIEPAAGSDAWVLAADFAIALPGRLEDAVNRGVALYFVVEFELVRPRWYWWDEKTVSLSRSYRLSYHALTRQYRVTLNGFQQAFGALDEAISAMSRVRGWQVIDPGQTSAGTTYDAQVRMRLDGTMLPKPFQVSAITNRDWNLPSEWKRFKFTP